MKTGSSFGGKVSSLIIFTLFRLENMTHQQFEDDAKTVENDLQKLKDLLEKN